MVNGQPIKKESASAKKVDTSEGLTKLSPSESTPLGASVNSSKTTTATTQKGLPKTLTSAKLQELRSKVGLVAGALADFQTAGGVVAHSHKEYTLPSGSTYTAIKLFLIVRDANIVAVMSEDGLEFDVVAQVNE